MGGESYREVPDACQQQRAPERMPDLAPFTAGSFPLTAPTDGRRILQQPHVKPEKAYYNCASLPGKHACGCSDALLCCCWRSWGCSLRGSPIALTMQHASVSESCLNAASWGQHPVSAAHMAPHTVRLAANIQRPVQQALQKVVQHAVPDGHCTSSLKAQHPPIARHQYAGSP